jgi:hypothetical protein
MNDLLSNPDFWAGLDKRAAEFEILRPFAY